MIIGTIKHRGGHPSLTIDIEQGQRAFVWKYEYMILYSIYTIYEYMGTDVQGGAFSSVTGATVKRHQLKFGKSV